MYDQPTTRGGMRPGFSLIFALLFGAVLMASGCTTDSAGSATPASDVSSTSTAPEPSRSPSAPPPSSPVPLSPANGTDVDACVDADCEIIVRGSVNIPLDQRFGFTEVTLTYVAPNTLEFDGSDSANGNTQANIKGTGRISANGVTITVEGYDQSGAIVRFTPPA